MIQSKGCYQFVVGNTVSYKTFKNSVSHLLHNIVVLKIADFFVFLVYLCHLSHFFHFLFYPGI